MFCKLGSLKRKNEKSFHMAREIQGVYGLPRLIPSLLNSILYKKQSIGHVTLKIVWGHTVAVQHFGFIIYSIHDDLEEWQGW